MRNKWARRLVILASVLLALGALLVWRMPELWSLKWYAESGSPAMTQGPIKLSEPVHWLDDYYAVADLGDGAYAIGEPRYGQCNFSYLILGSERALLFDTGPGVHNIQAAVGKLTTLPVIALPSHLHFDHVGNLGHFDSVALPDLPGLRSQVHDGKFVLGFEQFLGFVEGFKRPSFAVAQWVAPDSEIDLGGRRLRLVSVPGHTPDSIVLLERGANRLFAGDFIYPSDIYAFLPGANLTDYAKSAHRVALLLDGASVVYGAHGCDQGPTVGVPILRRSDVTDLEQALTTAAAQNWTGGAGIYPRVFPVNERMKLLAKYPWMSP
jgi:hydroxyacylglutathione hydrolase